MGRMFVVVLALSMMFSMVSAGVGVKWDKQSKLVEQGEKSCLTYSVYNPWPEDSYVKLTVVGDVEPIMRAESDEQMSKLIPANTASTEAIPVDFCFSVPYVYEEERDCLIGSLLCEQKCSGSQMTYEGEVLVTETGAPVSGGGSGGSSTSVSVSAPLNVRVQCIAYPRNFAPLYILISLIAALIVIYLIIKRNMKPKVERDREKLRRLQEEIKRESKKK